MVKEVVKYIPGDKENGKLEKVLHVGNKIELSRLSLMLSALSLLLAVVFFSLLLGWLWGVPNLVDKHQQEVERLEHLIEKQDIIIQSLMGNQEKDGSLVVPEKLGSVEDEFDVRSCLQDPSSGPCTTLSIQRWFFDRKAGRCKQFSFGGCEGNQNNFITARDCEEKCSGFKKDEGLDLISKADIKSVAGGEIFSNSLDEKPTHCFLEPAAGPCRGQVSRFYWDEEKMTCSKFFYGGCAGNKNNFITEQDCRNTCWIQ
ncbi:tissue factor pathway inhibitor, partial [Eurytemora carolleeae]|uniref:tissue factor pathway inhibitor n=1 Tax=Eurytemora carolleeae TaxID=1294199 RepID=UPI000C771390